MRQPKSCTVFAFAAVAAVSLAGAEMASAQGAKSQKGDAGTTWVDIRSWDSAGLYKGWSAERLLDEDVYGATGDDIGEVEDIIVGADGRIRKVVVEGGGFLDIGDSHVGVAWDKVTRIGATAIKVPIAEGNLDEYTLFGAEDTLPADPKSFRVRELIGDYVSAGGTGYGTVSDVIFSDEGKIQAVIVSPAYGYGYGARRVAMPYYAGAYDPYAPYYSVPYGVAQLKELRPFDYRRLE